MDKVNWKSFMPADAQYKSSASSEPLTEAKVEQEIKDVFMGSSSDEGASTPHPFSLTIGGTPPAPGTSYDPLTGEMVYDPKANPYYVPTLEELMTEAGIRGIEIQPSDFDTDIIPMYKDAIAAYSAEKEQREQFLASGAGTPQEVAYAKQLVSLIDKAIAISQEALKGIPKLKTELAQNYIKEVEDFKAAAAAPLADKFNKGDVTIQSEIIKKLALTDHNGDGYIGEPKKGIRIINDVEIDGKTGLSVLWDEDMQAYIRRLNSDGTPVTSKWFDPGRTWTLSKQGLSIADKKIGSEDLMVKIDGSNKIEYGNTFDAKIDLAVPDFIIVEADEDGIPTASMDEDLGEMRLEAANFVMDGSKIIQKVPEDMEGYVQVRIKEVKITSEENGDGFDQIVRFIATDGAVAAEIRITGNATGQASDYGFALNAGEGKEKRESSVIVHAENMKSTFKHSISGNRNSGTLRTLYNEYNVDLNKLDDPKGKRDSVFDATMGSFSSGAYTVSDEFQATALMSYGLNGAIYGSKHGDNLVMFGDPSINYTDEPRVGKDEGVNPFFSNEYFGGKGRDAVFSKGGGDLYATGVTLLWRDTQKKMNTYTGVSVKDYLEVTGSGTDQAGYTAVGVPVFVYISGDGEKAIDNPSDGDKETGAVNPDDYLNSEGEAVYSIPQGEEGIGDPDADTAISEGDTDVPVIAADSVAKKASKLAQALEDADLDEVDPFKDLDITKLGGDVYELAADELAGFFEEIGNTFGFKNQGMEDSEE